MVFIEKSIFIILKKIDLYFSHLLDYTDPKYPKHSFSTLSETEIEKILQSIHYRIFPTSLFGVIDGWWVIPHLMEDGGTCDDE